MGLLDNCTIKSPGRTLGDSTAPVMEMGQDPTRMEVPDVALDVHHGAAAGKHGGGAAEFMLTGWFALTWWL